MAKERTQGSRFGIVLLSILWVILTLVCSTLCVSCFVLYRTAQNDTLSKAVGDIFDSKQSSDLRSGVAEYILDEFVGDERVSLENVERLLGDGTFGEFAEEIIADYNRYLKEGGEAPTLDAEEFVGLIEENADLIREETGLQFLEPDKQKLRQNLDGIFKEADPIMEVVVGNDLVRTVFSIWPAVIFSALLALILLWMLIIYVKNRFRAGTALIIYSIAGMIPCLGMMVQTAVNAFSLRSLHLAFLNSFIRPFNEDLLLCGGIGVGIAVFLLILGIVLNRMTKPQTIPAASEIQYDPMDSSPVRADIETPVMQTAEPTFAETAMPQRKYCRNCGQPLVNPDAKFCYKCGNVQEHAVSLKKETDGE